MSFDILHLIHQARASYPQYYCIDIPQDVHDGTRASLISSVTVDAYKCRFYPRSIESATNQWYSLTRINLILFFNQHSVLYPNFEFYNQLNFCTIMWLWLHQYTETHCWGSTQNRKVLHFLFLEIFTQKYPAYSNDLLSECLQQSLLAHF